MRLAVAAVAFLSATYEVQIIFGLQLFLTQNSVKPFKETQMIRCNTIKSFLFQTVSNMVTDAVIDGKSSRH